MQIQPISNNQNFTGRFLFLKIAKENIVSSDVENHLSFLNKEDLDIVRKKISSKPYDLYISKSDDLEGFYELNANAKLENILYKRSIRELDPVILNERKSENLYSASNQAMRKYEQSDNYLNDTKVENPLKLMFRKIFKK